MEAVRMARDDLETYIAERAEREPELPGLISAAEQRQAVARQLAALRKETALTQTQIAAKMSSSPSVVSRIESGGDVRLSTLQKYANALGRDLTISVASAPAERPKVRAGR
jgi:predicted transcriptional regulator